MAIRKSTNRLCHDTSYGVISTLSLIVIPSEARNLSFRSGQVPGEILIFSISIRYEIPHRPWLLGMTAYHNFDTT
jgi:hypothetical protein